MDHTRRLALLKAHKLDLGDGPVFDNHSHCVDWVNKVAPLLKYDDEHYQEFMGHAQVMMPEHISVNQRMTSIRSLAGIVDRAVIELENKIEPNHAADPTSSKPDEGVEPGWHKTTWGKTILRVIYVVATLGVLFLIKYCFGIDLKS